MLSTINVIFLYETGPIQWLSILSAAWLLLAWCFSAKPAVATLLITHPIIMHPCIASHLWVNLWVKDQLKLPTILPLRLHNFVACGRVWPSPHVIKLCNSSGQIVDSNTYFLVDPSCLDQNDLVRWKWDVRKAFKFLLPSLYVCSKNTKVEWLLWCWHIWILNKLSVCSYQMIYGETTMSCTHCEHRYQP